MRALTTKTTLTTGQAVQRARRFTEKHKQERTCVAHWYIMNLGNSSLIICSCTVEMCPIDSRMINKLRSMLEFLRSADLRP